MKSKSLVLKLILFIAILVISYLVFSRPTYSQNTIPYFDKIGHISSFFILTGLTYLAFRPHWVIIFSIMAGYGILIEVIQYFIPYRGAEVADVIADLSGVVLFYLVRFIYKKCIKSKTNNASSVIDNE